MNEDVVVVAAIVVVVFLVSAAAGITDVFSTKPNLTDSIYSTPTYPSVLPQGSFLSPPMHPPRTLRRGYIPITPKKLFSDTFNPNSLFYDEKEQRGALTSVGGKRKTRRKTRRI